MLKLKQFSLISGVLLLGVIISVLYLDRPLALFMHKNGFDQLLQLRYITEYLTYIIGMTVLIMIMLKKDFLGWMRKLITMGYAYGTLYITITVKNLLKIGFGRYWPKTWIHNNLSLINNNVYGFNFFHGSATIGAFPSGHSTFVLFCVIWLLRFMPEYKGAFIFMGLLVPLCLIILDYHFLGDCLAGIILGIDFGGFSIVLYEFLIRKYKLRVGYE